MYVTTSAMFATDVSDWLASFTVYLRLLRLYNLPIDRDQHQLIEESRVPIRHNSQGHFFLRLLKFTRRVLDITPPPTSQPPTATSGRRRRRRRQTLAQHGPW